MRMIRQSELPTIEKLLLSLGGANLADNIDQIMRFQRHWLVELTKEEFFSLVFLQTDGLLAICPRGQDRTLRAVAERANELGQPDLCGNWNLADNLRRMREQVALGQANSQPLLILESRPNEVHYGPFYLQDGSHRAIAYATLVLRGELPYEERLAYCSMSQSLCNKLLTRKT